MGKVIQGGSREYSSLLGQALGDLVTAFDSVVCDRSGLQKRGRVRLRPLGSSVQSSPGPVLERSVAMCTESSLASFFQQFLTQLTLGLFPHRVRRFEGPSVAQRVPDTFIFHLCFCVPILALCTQTHTYAHAHNVYTYVHIVHTHTYTHSPVLHAGVPVPDLLSGRKSSNVL